MEADFLRYYSLELGEALESRPLWAMSLAQQLPADSAFVRAHTGGQSWGWTQEAIIAIIDLLQIQTRVTLAAAGVKKHAIPKMVDVSRPFDEPKEKPKPMPVEEMIKHVGGLFAQATKGGSSG